MIKENFQDTKKYEKLISRLNLQDFSRSSNLYGILFSNEYFLPNISKLEKYNKVTNINFAINDFRNLITELQNQSKMFRIPKTSKFNIGNLKYNENVFIDPYKNYENYLFLFCSTFSRELKTVKSFNEFFLKIYTSIFQVAQFLTFSGFLKSDLVSIFSSGLAFFVANVPSPTLKIAEEYVKDPYFKMFAAICSKHNFYIDKYMPWLIVRRVDDSVFNNNIESYIDIYQNDIDILYDAMKNVYIRFVNTFVSKKDLEKLDLSNFNLNFHLLVNFFIKLKLKESKIDFKEKDVNDLYRFFLSNSKHNSIKDSVKKLDRITSTEFDSVLQNWTQIHL